ncbi:hypothetical protein D9M71_665420 [compost metagenome]
MQLPTDAGARDPDGSLTYAAKPLCTVPHLLGELRVEDRERAGAISSACVDTATVRNAVGKPDPIASVKPCIVTTLVSMQVPIVILKVCSALPTLAQEFSVSPCAWAAVDGADSPVNISQGYTQRVGD